MDAASAARNAQFAASMPCRLRNSRIASGVSNGRLKPTVTTLNVPAPSARCASPTARSRKRVVVGHTCEQPV